MPDVRALHIPDSPDEHLAELCELLGPLATHPHWRRVAEVLVAERAPLCYSAHLDGEDRNLSMWFGLLDRRDGRYAQHPTLRALYVAHEFAHLLCATPHSADRDGFADAFHTSERFASYETEIRVHDDLPCLAPTLPFTPALYRRLVAAGVDVRDAAVVIAWRDAAIGNPELLADLPDEAARLGSYRHTRAWARSYWDRLDRLGWWADPLEETDCTVFYPGPYRQLVETADATCDEERWARLVCNNVRRAYRLCGLADPHVATVAEARRAAARLDGRPLATEQTEKMAELEVPR